MDEPASYSFNLLLDTATSPPQIDFVSAGLKILLVFVLVAANGFFVAAEFALVSVRRSRIETLATSGSRSAIRLIAILNKLNAYLSASQLGITLASLGLGWAGEPTVAALLTTPLTRFGIAENWQHAISFIVSFAIITSLHIVLGEQAPKLFGLERAEKVALWTTLPLQLFYKIFSLPIRLLDWASAKTVRLFGLHSSAEHGASTYTEEELLQLIVLSHKSGYVNEREQDIIHRVFQFSDTLVREAMVPRTEIAAISNVCTLEQIVLAFNKYGYSRLPVYRESLDDAVGFIHSKDVLPFLLRPQTFRLEKVLQTPQYVVDTARLEDVLKQMQRDKFHFGFVVDEHGGVEGIITIEDLLEEIVGDISDEHDEEVNEQIAPQRDGTFLLDGGVAVRDLNRRLQLELPESENYTTIAGFLMDEAGHILQQGETIPYDDWQFHVERVNKRRVVSVRLEKTETPDRETAPALNGNGANG